MIHRQSLVRRLLLTFTVLLLGIWLTILGWDLHEMHPIQKQDTQRELRGTAYRILAVVQAISDRPDAIPAVVEKMERLHHTFYQHSWQWRVPSLQTQVWKGRTLLYASTGRELPATLASAGPDQQPLKDGWVSSIAVDPDTGITVRMATEFIGQWAVLGFTSIGYYFNPLLFSLPLLLLPAWLIVRRGLRPLNTIVAEIEDRSGSDLSSLHSSPYTELSPLVGSVNHLMARLKERLEREQEFLIDAAHEIKTPLAIIQINASALDGSPAPQIVDEAIAGLHRGVDRATHTVRQLLALLQSDFDAHRDDLQQADLIEILREQMVLATEIAMHRHIQIAFQGPERCLLPMHRESMSSLIDNLLGNAVRYSPGNSRIAVAVKIQAHCVQLTVTDQGPGIAPALRKKVFERFYRLPGQEEAGSGLGLAIAARAAARNLGVVRLEAGDADVGLSAILELPVAGNSTDGLVFSPAVATSKTTMQRARIWLRSLAGKMAGMRSRSLFRRMLFGFMAVVASIWLCYLAWDVIDAKTVKIKGMQGELQRTSQRILVTMQALSDRPEKIPAVVKEMEELHYAFYQKRGWYVPPLQTQIWKDHKLIYVTADPRLPTTFALADAADQPIKDGWISWIETDTQSGVTVRMATELVADWFFSSASIGYFLKPLLFCLPLLLALAAFAIRFGLRPLNTIVREIEHRSASDLRPLMPSPYAELAPLVNAVNRLMERLTQRLAREQEFLADAARELQAPLARVRTSLDLLNNRDGMTLLVKIACDVHQAVERAAHTVHQLLALSRSGSDRDKGDLQQINLVELLRDRLALAMQMAIPREIKISLHSPEQCILPLHRESMASLIDNLVSNAVKHSPDKAKVTVSLKVHERSAQLVVADKGPGIAPALRDRVFERFYRHPELKGGNGLGLAIAARAAARNFGTIFLETGRNGIGLSVVVQFPLGASSLLPGVA